MRVNGLNVCFIARLYANVLVELYGIVYFFHLWLGEFCILFWKIKILHVDVMDITVCLLPCVFFSPLDTNGCGESSSHLSARMKDECLIRWVRTPMLVLEQRWEKTRPNKNLRNTWKNSWKIAKSNFIFLTYRNLVLYGEVCCVLFMFES